MTSSWTFLRSSVKILSYLHEVSKDYQEFEDSFCGPQANGLPSILWHEALDESLSTLSITLPKIASLSSRA